MPLIEWTIVRLVVSENDGRRHNSEMEQERRIDSLSRMPRRTKTFHLGKTTRRVRVHVQAVGLNAEEKKIGIEPKESTLLLTFLFIGLQR